MLPEYVAVYGTLRRGMRASHLLDEPNFVFVGEDQVHATMYRIGAYPGILFNTEVNTTDVEVYRINNPEALWAVHHYEGYFGADMSKRNLWNQNLFTPRLVQTLHLRLKVLCYEYTGNEQIAFPIRDNPNKIAGGNWAVYLSEAAAA